jgi:hypothetical protein
MLYWGVLCWDDCGQQCRWKCQHVTGLITTCLYVDFYVLNFVTMNRTSSTLLTECNIFVCWLQLKRHMQIHVIIIWLLEIGNWLPSAHVFLQLVGLDPIVGAGLSRTAASRWCWRFGGDTKSLSSLLTASTGNGLFSTFFLAAILVCNT